MGHAVSAISQSRRSTRQGRSLFAHLVGFDRAGPQATTADDLNGSGKPGQLGKDFVLVSTWSAFAFDMAVFVLQARISSSIPTGIVTTFPTASRMSC